jgi:isopenicillin-N epimerase
MKLPNYSPLATHWHLRKDIVFISHGTFGACPIPVLQKQQELIIQMEQQPLQFLAHELEGRLYDVKECLSAFIGTTPNNIVLQPNATTGVNTVLQSIKLNEGDEILTTNHVYGACLNALNHKAKNEKLNIVIANIAYPIIDEDAIIGAIVEKVTNRTKLALIDHITSASGIIFPIEKITQILQEKGVDVLVDGAHAPGQLPLNLDKLAAAYYTGNCHKWICSPKGSAFLYVRSDKQQQIKPIQYSHYPDRPQDNNWTSNFIWDGTHDFSPLLCIPKAIEFMGSLFDNGWEGLRSHNHQMAIAARKMIAEKTGGFLPCPDNMVGQFANINLPDGELPAYRFFYEPILKRELLDKYFIEVPIMFFPKPPKQFVRIACQAYSSMEQFEYLANCINELNSNNFFGLKR